MALHGNQLARFIDPEQSTLQLITDDESNEDSSYVVMAHIYGIISRTPFSLDLAVADHTDKAIFSVRGDAAFAFYSNHLYHYADHEEIVDPYALDNEWEQTYLFKICTSQLTRVLGHTAFIVNDICMMNPNKPVCCNQNEPGGTQQLSSRDPECRSKNFPRNYRLIIYFRLWRRSSQDYRWV